MTMKSLEERVALLEDKMKFLWAGNPPHESDLPGYDDSHKEYPKQVDKDFVAYSKEEEDEYKRGKSRTGLEVLSSASDFNSSQRS